MVKPLLLAVLFSFLSLTVINLANAETDSELFSRGEKFLNNSEFDSAIKTFQTLIDKYPYSKFIPYAIYDQALAFLEIGEYQQAEANFKRIGRDFSYLKDLIPKAQFGLAECYLRMGKDDLADSIYSSLLNKDLAKAPDVLFNKAWVYYKQDKWDLAAAFFKRMVERYPTDQKALDAKFMLASIYKEQGRYKRAVDVFKTIPKDSKLANDTYFNLGEIAFKVKNYSKAVEFFRNVKPKSEIFGEKANLAELARYQTGLAYYEQGKIYEVRIICEDFLERYPESKLTKDVCHLLVLAYLKQRKADEAAQAYKDYSRLDPEGARKLNINFFMGESFYEKGEYKKALGFYQKQLAESKEAEYTEKSLARLGESHFYLNDYAKAEEVYKEYLKTYPNGPSAPHFAFRLAYIFATQNNYASALKLYKMIEEKFPKLEYIDNVIYNIGWCYSRSGESGEALAYFKKFIESYPENKLAPATAYEIGNIYFNNRQYSQAADYYKQVVEKYPQSEMAQAASYRLGISHLYSAKRDEALNELKVFLDNNPTSPLAVEVINSIYNIYLNQKKYREGIAAFEYLAEKHSQQKAILAELYSCLANMYLISGDSSRAVKTVQELLSAYNDFSDTPPPENAAYTIGQILVEANNESEAIKFYSDILARYKDDTLTEVSLFGRGQAYLKLKSWQEASGDFSELIFKYPNTKYASRAKLGIANSYYNRDIFSEAVRYYKDVVDNYKDETTAEALFKLGNSYFAQKKYAESLPNFQRVAILYPHREELAAESLLKAGECQDKLGNKQEAKALYEKLVVKYPKMEEAKKAQERLRSIK